MDTQSQEPRTERITVAVTSTEKQLIGLAALRRGLDGVSTLLREVSVHDAVAEGREILRHVQQAA